jgi:hypothetical protein
MVKLDFINFFKEVLMKSMARFFALACMVLFVGCATMESGGKSAPAPEASKASSSKGGMLTDEDYKRIGIQEVDRKN